MATSEVLQGYLADAEAALHKLVTGVRVVSVGYEGKNVNYTAADEGKLRAYIASLKSQLGLATRRPLRPMF